jgi:hypothetical protein
MHVKEMKIKNEKELILESESTSRLTRIKKTEKSLKSIKLIYN